MKRISLLLLVILTTLNSFGATGTFYFSSSYTGTTSTGSITQPYKSLTILNSMIKGTFTGVTASGSTFLLKRGDEFNDTLAATQGGFTIDSYTDNGTDISVKPIITGLKKVTGWTAVSGHTNVWQCNAITTTKHDVQQLTVDNVYFAKGRWPNADAANYGFLKYATTNVKTNFVDKSWGSYTKPYGTTDWSGAQLAFRENHFRFQVVDVDQTITGPKGDTCLFNLGGSYTLVNGYGYFIENHINTLDKKGEWAFDRAANIIYLYWPTDPDNNVVRVSQQNTIVDFGSQSNITIKNIAVNYADGYGIHASGGSNITVINCDMKYAKGSPLRIDRVANWWVDKCNIDSSLTYGPYFLNVLNSAGANAYGTFIRNTVNHTMPYYGMGNGGIAGYATSFIGQNFNVKYNKISHSGYTAIDHESTIYSARDNPKECCNYGSNQIIENNIIDGSSEMLSDGGAAYTNNQSFQFNFRNKIFRKNIIKNTDNALPGPSVGTFSNLRLSMVMYGDQYTNHWLYDGNILLGGRVGWYSNDPEDDTLINNTFIDFGSTSGNGFGVAMEIQENHLEGEPYCWSHGKTCEQMTTSGPALARNYMKNNVYFNWKKGNSVPEVFGALSYSTTATAATPAGWLNSDHNYLIYPFSNSTTAKWFQDETHSDLGYPTVYRTLADWQAKYGYETNPTISPKDYSTNTTTKPDTLYMYLVNEDTVSHIYTLRGKTWITAKGVVRNTNLDTLEPFTAEVYIYTGQYTGSTPTVNDAPTVALTSPLDNTEYTVGDSVNLEADASDADGISKVEFYNGTQLIFTEKLAPYQRYWTGLAAGTYHITAKAYDTKNATTVTDVHDITVSNSLPPVIKLTSDSSTYTDPAVVILSADAKSQNAGGSIDHIDFYNGTTLLGTVDASSGTSPYKYTVNTLAVGTYGLKAIATDESGNTSAATLSVTVKTPDVIVPIGPGTKAFKGLKYFKVIKK